MYCCVLDGEIVCLGNDGGSRFRDLLYRRQWPFFMALDALPIENQDLRTFPLRERKRRLAHMMPRIDSRLMYLDAIERRGCRLYELACEWDLEGIVAKWAGGTYQSDGRSTSWLKIKNPHYTQWVGRHELFEARRAEGPSRHARYDPPTLALRQTPDSGGRNAAAR